MSRIKWFGCLFLTPGLLLADTYSAGSVNTGDTAWMLVATAFVFLMTPGLAFFYAGLVRRKNVMEVLMKVFITISVVSLQWVLIGFSLSFSQGNGLIGGLKYFALSNLNIHHIYPGTHIPFILFVLFQGMFAIITPALIIGSFVERMKFSSYLIFTFLWSTLVYNPICHWVWASDGWIARLGALDFAGGTVIHINAGIAALIAALIIGKRQGKLLGPTPHSMPLTAIGLGMLWFGWFGFNGGSALGANGLAAYALLTTNTAAASGAFTWAIMEWKMKGAPSVLGFGGGALAGLVAITPAAGYVSVSSSIIFGIIATLICYTSVEFIKPKLGYDDSLDAFGIHGIGGIAGAMLTGIFASSSINPGIENGLIFGNPNLFLKQATATFATLAYSVVMTFILYKTVDQIFGVRVKEEEEMIGLDLVEHNEKAYSLLD